MTIINGLYLIAVVAILVIVFCLEWQGDITEHNEWRREDRLDDRKKTHTIMDEINDETATW